jgi:hypothetical protein
MPYAATGSEGRGALEATVEFSYDPDQLARFAAELPFAGLLDLECPTRQTMQLTVTVDSWVLELEEPTVFGSGMTLIRHRNGGAEYFDHETRTRLAFAAEDMLSPAVRHPGRWEVSDPEHDDAPIEVALEDRVSGQRWVQRIRTGPPCQDTELVLSFLEGVLVGGFAQSSHYPLREIGRVVNRRGLPTEITLHAEGDEEPASRITLTYRDSDAPPSSRTLEDYDDLRDPNNRNAWSRAGRGLRKVRARDVDELRDFDDEEDSEGEEPRALMMIRNGPDREQDPEPHDRPGNRPPRTITTNAASVALRIEQRLLDDVRRTVNAIAAHAAPITTTGTDLIIPWLEDTVVSSRKLDPWKPDPIDPTKKDRTKTKPGTGLPALLHEDPGLGQGNDPMDNLKSYKNPDGHGVVDRMAAARAREYLATNTIPASILAGLSAADKLEIQDVTSGSAPPNKRIEWLTTGARIRLITAVLFEDVGTLRFSLRGLSEEINFYDLYLVQLSKIRISLAFPAATTTSNVPPTPLEAPVLTALQCRSGGRLEGTIAIDYLRVDAELNRTPTLLYWTLLFAGGPAIAVFMPALAWVIPILWSISVFLAFDFSTLQLEAKPLGAAISVDFVPVPGGLRPRVSVRMTGSLRIRMLSHVPTGIHQLVDFALAGLLSHFTEALSAFLEDQLRSALQQILDRTITAYAVPSSLLRPQVPVASATAGVDDKYVYIESTFGPSTEPSIRITPTPVSAALRFDLERDIERAFGATGDDGRGRHYLSLGASVNAVNQVAAVLWRWGVFNAGVMTGGLTNMLRPFLTAPFSGPVLRVDAYHRAPPVFSFPASGPTGPRHYFDVVFPSFVVIVNRYSLDYWAFRYRITASGVLGMGAVPFGGRFLALPTNIGPTVFEALIDLASVNATLLEASQITETTITVTEPGEDPYHPDVVHTYTEIVEETTDRTAGAPPGWRDYGRGIFVLANGGRDAGLVPRLDGFKADGHPALDKNNNPLWPLDGASQQSYTTDGSDPDDGTPTISGVTIAGYAQLPVDWGFNQGLSFAHVEVSGAFEQLLSGEKPINGFWIIEAESFYPFLDKMIPLGG